MTAIAPCPERLTGKASLSGPGRSLAHAGTSFRTLLGHALSEGEAALSGAGTSAARALTGLVAGVEKGAASPAGPAAASAQEALGAAPATSKALALGAAAASGTELALARQVGPAAGLAGQGALAPRRRGKASAEDAAPEAGAQAQAAQAQASPTAASTRVSGEVHLVGAAEARLSSPVARKEPEADPTAAPAHGARPAGAAASASEKATSAEEAKVTAPAPSAVRPDLWQAGASAVPAAAPAAARLPSTSSPAAPSQALPAPSAGQDVQGAVLTNAAHLRIDTGSQGALELHLRVRDGSLHLRVDGDSAHLVEAQAGELSRSLAGQGLKLAPIETSPPSEQGLHTSSDGGRQGEERREAWQEAAEAREQAAPPATARSGSAGATGPGIHVKA
ncbi:MAG TPA: flagellar hook-length control protein FliK [Anaeromyxobacteraceae bacterium]|nr:flagellar hook-length control protein FliK [Anaeromyxobacteraceae bacterium]